MSISKYANYKRLLTNPYIYGALFIIRASTGRNAMHIAASIIANLQSTFEGIYNIKEAVAGESNQTVRDSLSVFAYGVYSDTVSRVYTITITRAGSVGVAECAITDSLGVDTVLSDVVINSGQEISIGTKGVKLKFNMQGTDAFVVGDSWTIDCNHLYRTNTRQVVQAEGGPQHLQTPGIAFAFQGIEYRDLGSSNKYKCDMNVSVELWIGNCQNGDINTNILYGLEDIEYALLLDPSRGGYAQDTRIINCTPFLPVPGQPFAAISVELGIWFDNYIQ